MERTWNSAQSLMFLTEQYASPLWNWQRCLSVQHSAARRCFFTRFLSFIAILVSNVIGCMYVCTLYIMLLVVCFWCRLVYAYERAAMPCTKMVWCLLRYAAIGPMATATSDYFGMTVPNVDWRRKICHDLSHLQRLWVTSRLRRSSNEVVRHWLPAVPGNNVED